MANAKAEKKRKNKNISSTAISISVNDPDASVDPVVASFPSGLPEGLTKESDANVPQFVWKRIKEGKKNGKSLMGTDDACIYHAKSHLRSTEDDRNTKLCVGIYDKQTGKLVLHQAAERGYIFTTQQSVKSYKDTSLTALPGHLTSLEQRRLLFESFGSQKKQRVLKSQAANMINIDAVVGAGETMMNAFGQQNLSESNKKAMVEAKNGTKVDAAEAAYEEARRKFLPSYDADAEEPHLIYDARDMGGDQAWGYVSRVVDACLHKDDWLESLTSQGQWANSVVGVLQIIPRDAPHAKYQIKCAVLLNYMIKFANEFSRARRNFSRGPADEIAKYFRMPQDVCSRFLELFATFMTNQSGMDGFVMSKQSRDKCLVHILLLYLMAHGRSMSVGNARPVVDDVKIELGDASNLLRAAGCSVAKKSGSNVMSAALKIPLTFPPPPKRAARGGP